MQRPTWQNRTTRPQQQLTLTMLLILATGAATTAHSNYRAASFSSNKRTSISAWGDPSSRNLKPPQTSAPNLGLRDTPVELAPSQVRSGEPSRSLSDLVIDHYEITNSSRGEVKIVVVNKGGGSSVPSTLRLIVLKAGRLGQKETATVFAKVPILASGQTTFIFVKAGVPISKRKHAISIDISEDSK